MWADSEEDTPEFEQGSQEGAQHVLDVLRSIGSYWIFERERRAIIDAFPSPVHAGVSTPWTRGFVHGVKFGFRHRNPAVRYFGGWDEYQRIWARPS